MKTQRTPDKAQAEYCLIPITHKASHVRLRAAPDVQKTWQAYGWAPKHDKQRSKT